MNQDLAPMTRQGLVRALGRVPVRELVGERQPGGVRARHVVLIVSKIMLEVHDPKELHKIPC
jgi:hypothetical protein